MENTSFLVPAITCNVCSKKIQDGLNEMNGVKNVAVDLVGKSVSIDYNSKQVTPTQLQALVMALGYEVE